MSIGTMAFSRFAFTVCLVLALILTFCKPERRSLNMLPYFSRFWRKGSRAMFIPQIFRSSAHCECCIFVYREEELKRQLCVRNFIFACAWRHVF